MRVKTRSVVGAGEEVIGREVRVVDAKNRSLFGIRGEIVDETKESWVIEGGGRRRRVLKSGVVLEDNNGSIISGEMMKARSWERIKLESKRVRTAKVIVRDK